MTEFASGAANDALADANPDRGHVGVSIRRAALDCLRRSNGPLTIAEVADRTVEQIDHKGPLNRSSTASDADPGAGDEGAAEASETDASDDRAPVRATEADAAWRESERDLSRHERVQQVYLTLVRRHVPALEERGVVDYDRENGELALTDRVQS